MALGLYTMYTPRETTTTNDSASMNELVEPALVSAASTWPVHVPRGPMSIHMSPGRNISVMQPVLTMGLCSSRRTKYGVRLSACNAGRNLNRK